MHQDKPNTHFHIDVFPRFDSLDPHLILIRFSFNSYVRIVCSTHHHTRVEAVVALRCGTVEEHNTHMRLLHTCRRV